MGLNILGYTLFFAGGIDRPRVCILTRNKTTWMLPGFSCRDLVAVLIKYNEDGAEDSSEPSLSDHRHILFTLQGSVPVRLIRNTN
jgi:hypothetical protein